MWKRGCLYVDSGGDMRLPPDVYGQSVTLCLRGVDGLEAIFRAYQDMRAACESLILVGDGPGVFAALIVAERYPVEGVVLVGGPHRATHEPSRRFRALKRLAMERLYAVIAPCVTLLPANASRTFVRLAARLPAPSESLPDDPEPRAAHIVSTVLRLGLRDNE